MIFNLLEKINPHPLMGEILDEYNTTVLDFTDANHELVNVDLKDHKDFQHFVDLQMEGKRFGIGGYMENRQIYRRSEVFSFGEAYRNIHLGIDIWGPDKSPVYAPLAGIVHSFQDNAGYGNYGPTIILQHQLQDQILYSLYGHLCKSDLEDLYEGRKFAKGELLCHLGAYEENGNWPPHLHFQLMLDMTNQKGDFPGVSSAADVEKFIKICPDPNLIIRFAGLSQ